MRSTLVIAALVALATHPFYTLAVEQKIHKVSVVPYQTPRALDNGFQFEDSSRKSSQPSQNDYQGRDVTETPYLTTPVPTEAPENGVKDGSPVDNSENKPNIKERGQFEGANGYGAQSSGCGGRPYQFPTYPDFNYGYGRYPTFGPGPAPSSFDPKPYPYPGYQAFGPGPAPYSEYSAFGQEPAPYPGYQTCGPGPAPYPEYSAFGQGPAPYPNYQGSGSYPRYPSDGPKPVPYPTYPTFGPGPFSGPFYDPQPSPDLNSPFNQRTRYPGFYDFERDFSSNSGQFGFDQVPAFGHNREESKLPTQETTESADPLVGENSNKPKIKGFIPKIISGAVAAGKGKFRISPSGLNHETTRSGESVRTFTR